MFPWKTVDELAVSFAKAGYIPSADFKYVQKASQGAIIIVLRRQALKDEIVVKTFLWAQCQLSITHLTFTTIFLCTQ